MEMKKKTKEEYVPLIKLTWNQDEDLGFYRREKSEELRSEGGWRGGMGKYKLKNLTSQ